MITSEIELLEVKEDRDKINLIDSNINLQYSLNLIEASIDYLFMIDTEKITDEKSAINITEKFISLPSFKNELCKILCSKEMLKEMLKDHERIIIQLRSSLEKYKDQGEANFISSLIEKHQSIARKLRKYF